MGKLKIILFVFSVVCLWGAITDTGEVYFHANKTGSELGGFGRLLALFEAMLFGFLSYAIHVHLPLGWKIGWFGLIFGYLIFAIASISGLLNKAPAITFAAFWLPASLVVILGAAFFGYWGYVWYRQKHYFASSPK